MPSHLGWLMVLSKTFLSSVIANDPSSSWRSSLSGGCFATISLKALIIDTASGASIATPKGPWDPSPMLKLSGNSVTPIGDRASALCFNVLPCAFQETEGSLAIGNYYLIVKKKWFCSAMPEAVFIHTD